MERIVSYIKEKLKSKYSNYLIIKNDLKGLEEGIKKYSEKICKDKFRGRGILFEIWGHLLTRLLKPCFFDFLYLLF